jgi:SOS response regulatory protein OraA/RecX
MRKVFENNDDVDDRSDDTNHYHNHENAGLHESESCNIQLVMSDSSMDHLFIQASKQWLRGHDLSTESRKARVVRWLQYRGFNWGVIAVILQRLQSQFSNLQEGDNININSSNGGGGHGNKRVESMDKLFREVSKQWIKGKNASIENRKARITRWLRYRGHSWDVVGVILKKLQSQ